MSLHTDTPRYQNPKDKTHTQSLNQQTSPFFQIRDNWQYNSANQNTTKVNRPNPQMVSPFLLGKGPGDRSRTPPNTHQVLTLTEQHWNKRSILTRRLSLVFLITVLFFFQPIQAQAQNQLTQNAQTPCITDFEDFLALAVQFSPTYDDAFFPIFDTNDDGVISFPDFISFAQTFNQNICLSLDSLVIKDQVSIQQIFSNQIPQNQTQINIPVIDTLRIAQEDPSFSLTTPIINLETGQTSSHNYIFNRYTFNKTNATRDTNITADANIRLVINGLIADSTIFTAEHWTLGIKGAYKFPQGSVTFSSPFTPAQATLGLRPFAPTNINLFTPGVYTEANAMVPASGDTLTETAARTALETFLAKRITNTDTLQQTLSKFDAPNLIAKMPNPTLRAGLISLTGTLGESGIDAILRGPFGPLTFGPVTTGDYAEIKSDRSVTVDERYTSEAFPLFAPIFTRMALQLDLQTGRAEETTTSAFLALVALQQTLTDSTIAQSGSELSRRLNTQMLARLNSGQTNFPNIGIYQTPNGQAFPNGSTFTSYAAVFAPLEDIPTPASNLLATYLKTLSPSNTELPNATSFNTNILTFLDQHQNVLSPQELIRTARILKLNTQK